MRWHLSLIVFFLTGMLEASQTGRDFMVTLSDQQWETVGDLTELEADVVIMRDGSVYYGEVQSVPDIHFPNADIPFEIHELGAMAVSVDTGRMQLVTQNGQNFIGDLREEAVYFTEYHQEEVSDEYGEYSETVQGEKYQFPVGQIDTIVFARRGELPNLVGRRVVSIVLQSGDRFAAILDTYSVRVTDGYQRWSIPTSSFSEVRYDGRLYGWLKAEAVDRELPPVLVENAMLELRLAMNGQSLQIPWEAIAVIKGDKGRFVTTTPYLVAPGNPNRMVRVPNGTFVMGNGGELKHNVIASFSSPFAYKRSAPTSKLVPTDTSPGFLIEMPAFYIDQYEVTNEEYNEFVRATGRRVPAHWTGGIYPSHLADHPVVNVSHKDASAYAAWAHKRLPTETEWERAAKGASGYLYPYGPQYLSHLANTETDGTKSVGSYALLVRKSRPHPNTLAEKIFDMSGNVAEWTASTFTKDYSERNRDDGRLYNPYRENPRGKFKVVRGGSYSSSAATASTVYRTRMHVDDFNPQTGFRCVKDEELKL